MVAAVRPRTPAAAAGLATGDRILAINGQHLRDAIDFQFHAADGRLALDVERGGERRAATLTRRPGGDLGLELEAPRPGEIATCANKCVFCFIHQLPRGMRRSLYVKDDDFRLSFLHGNYITLTDLDEPALQRIVDQRLSPLYVSVHATDPVVRRWLLRNPSAPEILPQLRHFAAHGIEFHTQVVMSPGVNDGAVLEQTLGDLWDFGTTVLSVSVVPVGLTEFSGLMALVAYGIPQPTAAVIILALRVQATGMTIVVASGLLFLLRDQLSGTPSDRRTGPPSSYRGAGSIGRGDPVSR